MLKVAEHSFPSSSHLMLHLGITRIGFNPYLQSWQRWKVTMDVQAVRVISGAFRISKATRAIKKKNILKNSIFANCKKNPVINFSSWAVESLQ